MSIESLRGPLKIIVPRPVWSLLAGTRTRIRFNSLYRKFLYKYHDFKDRAHIKRSGFGRLPPAFLRHQVGRMPHLDRFLEVGRKCSADIETALERIGRTINSFESVLDFGCGCGRTLIWLARRAQSPRFYGTDTDAAAIAWCVKNLDCAQFVLGQPTPPSTYTGEMFDLIYALSVFTHLNEDYQFLWLSELKRLLKPEGIIILTLLGSHLHAHLTAQQRIEVQRKGFVFSKSFPKGFHPDWYQNAFHTREYVYQNYSKYFDVLDYTSRGMNNQQDVVVLRQPE